MAPRSLLRDACSKASWLSMRVDVTCEAAEASTLALEARRERLADAPEEAVASELVLYEIALIEWRATLLRATEAVADLQDCMAEIADLLAQTKPPDGA